MKDILKGGATHGQNNRQFSGTAQGRKQAHKNLALYPLLSSCAIRLDYLLLDEAPSENMIEVVEVSEGGSVPELKVVNKSVRLVLILDDEERVGAKQKLISQYEHRPQSPDPVED